LVLAGPKPRRHALAVEWTPDQLFQMRVWVELCADRADESRPFVERELVTVVAVQLLVREARRSLCVDEETVEVEQEPADCHGVSLPEWAFSASTSGEPSRTPCSCTTASCGLRKS